MIRPENIATAAFGGAADGDPRSDSATRRRLSASLGIPDAWAWMRQVHGSAVVRADGAGELGEADAIYTMTPGLPLAVATADCFPVVLAGSGAIGLAHAGWRGAASGVVESLCDAMSAAGARPSHAAIGPGIRSCCFEVGPNVTERFAGFASTTDWGTPSVDLAASVGSALSGLDLWASGECTMSGSGYHSYRRDGTDERQVAVAWLQD